MNDARIEDLTGALEDLTEQMQRREQVIVQPPEVKFSPVINVPPQERRSYRMTVLSRDQSGDILTARFDPI